VSDALALTVFPASGHVTLCGLVVEVWFAARRRA